MTHLHVQPKTGKPKAGRHILGWRGHAQVEMLRRRRAAVIAKKARKTNRRHS